MLLKRSIKPIFKNKANGITTVNLPKEFADKCDNKVVFDVYEDKAVMTPLKKGE